MERAPSSDGGSDISSYALRYSKTSELLLSYIATTFKSDVWISGDGDLTATITGLEVGTQYSVQVRAVNVAGNEPLVGLEGRDNCAFRRRR